MGEPEAAYMAMGVATGTESTVVVREAQATPAATAVARAVREGWVAAHSCRAHSADTPRSQSHTTVACWSNH